MKNQSTINFMYFANNFPFNWIQKVWSDDQGMANHLNDKWNDLNLSNELGGTNNLLKLFMQLDNNNQNHLLDWIENNYNYKG
jgi:hypothetical protein